MESARFGGVEAVMKQEAVLEFKSQLRGEVIEPTDPRYDEARKVYNAMISRKPRLIAKCVDVADVITAVRFGSQQNLKVSIRGGGHNAGGLGVCDDGLVIDLSPIKYVHVNPAAKTVRVGGGCTWGDVDHATHAFGLAVPSGIIGNDWSWRPDAWWRHGAPHATVRPDDRQPAGGGRCACRWALRGGECDRERRSVLGDSRRRWQLWRGDVIPLPGPSGRIRCARVRCCGTWIKPPTS